MASFFGKLKSGTGPTSPSVGSPSAKKDPNAPPPTPLEKLLMNAGPIRSDGSDKFFGMENFGNTCYCNSMLQCLYYSAPFRENVLSYPVRSSSAALVAAAANAVPRPSTNIQAANGAAKKPVVAPISRSASTGQNQTQKTEDKDSPEYKKKQALLAGPILNMSYQNAASYDMPETIFTALKDIFEASVLNQSRTGVVSPTKFLEVLRRDNEMYRSAMHQDAHEFLNLLLNNVVEEIEKHEKRVVGETAQNEVEEKENHTIQNGAVSFPSLLPLPKVPEIKAGWVHELFEGTLTNETRCLTCENVSKRDETFLDLSVDIEQHSSVTSCLRRFSEEEMMCERNKFHCDNCGGLQEAEKRMKIKRLPRILALHLKRFKYTEDFQRLQKLFHKVVYPYHLRLFNTTDDAEDPDRLYELYAVVVHIGGGPFHGHYVAIIKTKDRGWLLFDDEMVEPVDSSFVRNFFGDRPGLACAYVLFYQETTFEAMQRDRKMEGRRASQDLPVGLGLKTRESAELHRVYSASPPLSPTSTFKYANLDHAVSAPPMPLNGHVEPPKSPNMLPVIVPSSPMVQSKKEKAKEEKDRKAAEKAAEKEKEKAEKQKRKENDSRPKESNATEDERKPLVDSTNKELSQTNGATLSGLDRFRRSRSLKFAPLGKKDKPSVFTEEPANTSSADQAPPASATPEKEKEKRNRFSIRKKSFGLS